MNLYVDTASVTRYLPNRVIITVTESEAMAAIGQEGQYWVIDSGGKILMQGTAADIIKIAMARVARRMRDEGFRARMILQVHDELDFECPEDEVEALTALVREVMEGVVELRVPLIADASSGTTWADAK